MELCKIQESDHAYLEALLIEAFPPKERPPFPMLLEQTAQGTADFWVIREENRSIGLAYLLPFDDIVYLFYFAVDSSCRGKGYGTKAMKAIMEKYEGRHILFSIEDWEQEAENTVQRIKRHEFYLRCGLKDLPFKVQGNGMVFALMSNSDTVGAEKCRKVMENIISAASAVATVHMEIIPR